MIDFKDAIQNIYKYQFVFTHRHSTHQAIIHVLQRNQSNVGYLKGQSLVLVHNIH